MAFAPLTLPPYPDVPLAPGVPPVPRNPRGAVTAISDAIVGSALYTTDGPLAGSGLISAATGQDWGLFDDTGAPVINADSFVSLEYTTESRLSDAPQEEGAFTTYDKIVVPFDLRVTLAKSGSDQDRADFFNECEAAKASLALSTLVTPEATYLNVNCFHVDYARKQHNGASLIQAGIWLRQIRVTSEAGFTNTAAPSGADAAQDGTVQPTTPTPSQSAAAAGGAT